MTTRQIPPGTNTLAAKAARSSTSGNEAAAIGLEAALAHRQVDQAGDDVFVVKTHGTKAAMTEISRHSHFVMNRHTRRSQAANHFGIAKKSRARYAHGRPLIRVPACAVAIDRPASASKMAAFTGGPLACNARSSACMSMQQADHLQQAQ